MRRDMLNHSPAMKGGCALWRVGNGDKAEICISVKPENCNTTVALENGLLPLEFK
jgi:hypothetical protein